MPSGRATDSKMMVQVGSIIMQLNATEEDVSNQTKKHTQLQAVYNRQKIGGFIYRW